MYKERMTNALPFVYLCPFMHMYDHTLPRMIVRFFVSHKTHSLFLQTGVWAILHDYCPLGQRVRAAQVLELRSQLIRDQVQRIHRWGDDAVQRAWHALHRQLVQQASRVGCLDDRAVLDGAELGGQRGEAA